MSIHFRKYKRKFRRHLQPVFAVLAAQRKQMHYSVWQEHVALTLSRIENNPIEYLGEDLPGPHLIKDVLAEIQSEFLKDILQVRSPQL